MRLVDVDTGRDAFINIVYVECSDDADNNRANAIIDAFDYLPIIEAEPVKRGHIVKKKRVIGGVEHHKCPECSHTWQEDKRCKIDEWLCSECGKVLADNYQNYCPNCGAKMEGEK